MAQMFYNIAVYQGMITVIKTLVPLTAYLAVPKF